MKKEKKKNGQPRLITLHTEYRGKRAKERSDFSNHCIEDKRKDKP